MDVVASAPFTARGVVWQEAEGQVTLTVVCKATYALRPGTSPLAREPEDINEHDNHWDDDRRRSVYAPSDLAPFKEKPEVLLVGSAYAPRGEPVRSVVVRVAIGDVDKSFEVFGQRQIDREGVQTDGALWTQMQLRYERAAGGEGSWNPVGVDPDASDAYGRRTLPNLAPLGADFGADVLRPIAFGPIAPAWPSRAEKLGRRAAGFDVARWNDTPLGDDFDGSYFQSAPDDQRLAILRADEPILLENLLPDHPRFVTKLCGVRPRVKVAPLGLPPWELTLTADTLWIDTNRAICTLTWRGQVPLDERDQPGAVLVGTEEPGKPVRWPSPVPAARPSAAGAAMPAPTPARSQPQPPPQTIEDTADGLPGAEDHDLHGHTVVDDGSLRAALGGDALPFRGRSRAPIADESSWDLPRPSAEAARPAPRPRVLGDEATGMLEMAAPRGSMPAWLGPRAPAASSEPPRPAPVAPPPPVGSLMRPAVTPFTSVAAASDAAIAAPPPPPPSVLAKPLGAAPPPPLAAPPLPLPSLGSVPSPSPAVAVPMPSSSFGASAPLWSPSSAPAAPPSSIGSGGPPPSFGALAGLVAPRASAERPAPPPPVDDKAMSKATYMGVFHASNAAAVAAPGDEEASKGEGAASAAAIVPRSLVDVIWFSPTVLGLVRDTPALAPLVPKPPSPSSADEAVTEDHTAKANRAAIAAVMARATPTGDVEAALTAAATEDGAIRPLAIVVNGEVELPFDEIERLKVIALVAAPLAASDKRLKETLDVAKEVLAVPQAASPENAASMTDKVREAWSKANRHLRPDHLDATSKRVLLEGRKYQLREILDAQWIRAVVTPIGARAAVPAYLPASLAKALPLFTKFPARLVAEVVPQQDEAETSPVALRVGALGRSVAAKARPR
jgi:hypothetical protein